MMRTLSTLMAGAAAATLAVGVALPAAAAQAAVVSAAKVPAPYQSLYVAGYQQAGCNNNGYPVYVEIQGTITVPAATDPGGTPGISYDIYSFGGVNSGVNAGVAVDNSDDQAFYFPYGQWNGMPVTAPFSVQPGDKLEVTIENEGTSGYLVELFDASNGQEWSQVNPDPNADQCQAAAYEVSPYPSYNYTTQTTPVAFDNTRVWWGEQGQGTASVSKLLGTPPAYAKLYRFNLVNTSGANVAVTSKPTDSDNNFTVTDAG